MSEERVPTGAWWAPQTWARARSAYVFDLDHNPQAPAGFIQWLHWVLQAHVARGPQGRAQLAIAGRGVTGASEGLNRHHPLRVETRAAMERAIIEDRQVGRLLSRSAWIHEAVTAAVADAELRAGGALQMVPVDQRLPNRPSKPGR